MSRRARRFSDLDRRTWMRAVGLGASSLAIGCTDRGPHDLAGAVLEPDDQGFIVAVWGDEPGDIAVEIRSGGEVVREDLIELPAHGTAAIEIGGLASDAAHEVTLSASGARTRTYRVRTAPKPDATRPVRIAVSGDFDPSSEFDSDLLAQTIAAEPELFVSLGDFPYTDNGPPAMTVGEYRSRHAETRRAPAARTLFEGVGVRAIYDDHEFRNDWDTARAANEASRYAAAIQVWDEFFPLRTGEPEVKYRSWRWGANLELFLLDVRRFRSANGMADGPGKSMLGDAQRAWLVDSITRSTATFKLVLSPVPLDFGTGNDHWSSFAVERAMILDALVGIPGVLVVAADQHYFAAHLHDHGVREVQVGPMARGIGALGPLAPGVLFRAQRYNVGLLDVHPDRLVVTALGEGGERFYEETLTPDSLTPR